MCHALLDVPACYAGYRQPCIDQARTDGGGGEKESSVLELCSLESVCEQACVYYYYFYYFFYFTRVKKKKKVYRHIAGCVFTTIFIQHKNNHIKCVQKCLLWMNLEWLRRLLHFPRDEHYRYGCWGHTPAILFRMCFDLHRKHDSREANQYSKVVILLK